MDPWLQSLKSFINTTLQRIIKSGVEREKYLTPEAMEIWSKAFTHETVSPSENYEDLEYLGDAVLKAVFPKYLMKRLPHLHKGEYTELNVAYMSKGGQGSEGNQGNLARKLGFNNYIRVRGLDRSTANLDTDVFESFFGALDEVSDLVSPGLGLINCYNMIVDIFKDVEIDESRKKGSAKTQVIQIFVRFDLPKPEEQTPGLSVRVAASEKLMNILGINTRLLGDSMDSNDETSRCEAYKQVISVLKEHNLVEVYEQHISKQGTENIPFAVKLRPQHLNFLRNYGVNITNPIIGYAEAPTKKQAIVDAYAKALKTLESYDIDTDWAEDAKLAMEFSGKDIERFVPDAIKRRNLEGYKRMYFFIPRKTVTANGAIVQLVGIRPDDKHQVLKVVYTTDKENSYRSSKVRLVREYASGM